MERGRYLQLLAFAPHRVVVVGAVETDVVVPNRQMGGVGMLLGDLGYRPVDHAVQHHGLEAQLADRVFQFGNGLVRVMHGNHRRRRHAVFQRLEQLGLIDVEGTACGLARLGVVHARQAEAHGGKQNGEVDAELVQALVQQPRHHRRGAIAGVFGGRTPERLLGDVLPSPFSWRHAQRATNAIAVNAHGAHRGIAADFAHRFANHRPVFQPMAVGVDYRMAETGAQFGTIVRHVYLPTKSDISL